MRDDDLGSHELTGTGDRLDDERPRVQDELQVELVDARARFAPALPDGVRGVHALSEVRIAGIDAVEDGLALR